MLKTISHYKNQIAQVVTYDIDESQLFSGTREKIISNALSTFRVEDRFGELILEVKDARFGDALYSFAQALIKWETCCACQQNESNPHLWMISNCFLKELSQKTVGSLIGTMKTMIPRKNIQ